MDSQSPITVFLQAIRRRHLFQLLASEVSLATALGMGVLSVLLVVGTQVLDWYWPLLVFGGTVAYGAWHAWRRFPSRYRLLQLADRRLDLHDSLSTAFHFSNTSGARAEANVRTSQLEQAENDARTADPAFAMPWRLPRSIYVAALATVAAGSLFFVRYGVRNSLDLRPPISNHLVEFFRPSEEMVQAWENPPVPEDIPEPAVPEVEQQREGEYQPETDSRLAEAQAPDMDADGLPPAADYDPANADPWDSESAPESSSQSESADDLPPAAAPENEPAESADSDSAPPDFNQEENDLLKKMQDAFANLMNKMNIPPQGGKGRRLTSERRESQSGEPKQQSMEQGSGEESEPGQEGQQGMQAMGQQSEEPGQQTSQGQGESQGQTADQPGQQNARSGAGQKDGAKELQAAQQLEAMGKLEEILGKRAEDLKGDIMVEVSSGPQTLTTEYTDTAATHTASGTQIHRDEIPLDLQPFIQRYFEEVHKPAQPPAQQ